MSWRDRWGRAGAKRRASESGADRSFSVVGSVVALVLLGGVSAAVAASGAPTPMAATAHVSVGAQPPSGVRAATAAELAALRAQYATLPSASAVLDAQSAAAAAAAAAAAVVPAVVDHSNDVVASQTIIAPAPLAGVSMLFPVNAPITSDFGLRLHPIFGDWRLHTGTDFGAACGTPAVATRAGTVTFSGVVSGYGNRVVIDHGLVSGKRLETTYNHLSLIAVTVGQPVRPNDPVGRVGTTGNSTGCHLHFEVMVDGAYTDPMPYLNGRPSTAIIAVPDATPAAPPTPSAAPGPAQASTPPAATPTPTPAATPTPTPTPTASDPDPSATPTPTPAPTPTATDTPTPAGGTSSTPAP